MNEIDPANSNGSAAHQTETHQQEATSSTNQSPLLSSLLTTSNNISNGQQSKGGQHMMPTPTIVTNPQYDEANAFMTRKSTTTNSEATTDELDLTTTTSTTALSHRKYSNLNDLLQRNNNNNKVTSNAETTASKSILENCLLKPSSHKTPQQPQPRLESQFYPNMEEGEYHHQHLTASPSTSSVLKFAHQAEDSRKVEPLKINLNREPIRTVIKIPPTQHPYEIPSKNRNSNTATISPTLSSSSSLSSESSYENSQENTNNQRPSSIQVIPKLLIRNCADGSMNNEQSELHIVPKLTITGLNSPQSSVNHSEQQQQTPQQLVRDHSVNSILDPSPGIPKLTIKKDNNTSDYHRNNDTNSTNSIPKLHIKTNHHHHHSKEVKMTIKAIQEPPVPKLTIKTKSDNEAMMVVANSVEEPAIPKLTIKSTKPVEESIPKLTLKAVNNSTTSPTFEKVVPKLLLKVPKEPESSSCSSTPSPPPTQHVPKLNIKPIPPPEKEVPKPAKNCVDSTSSLPPQPAADVKFSINRLINEDEEIQPLEINTTSVMKNTDSGLDSPRIILKINKTTSEILPNEVSPLKIPSANHKRAHSNEKDENEEAAKKSKLAEVEDDDVILINDSDTSSNDTVNKNHKVVAEVAKEPEGVLQQVTDTPKSNSNASRSLRQSRRNQEALKQKQKEQLKEPTPPSVTSEQEISQSTGKEDSQDVIDPLSLSNDATVNSNSVDELITPKRGRGRPKKNVEKPATPIIEQEESKDPLDIPVEVPEEQEPELETETEKVEKSTEVKKTPTRGRGRGRGRSKRTVEVMKNGKSVQITLEGHDDDDSPSYSLYNRSLRGGFASKRARGGRGMRGRGAKGSPAFATPERSKEAHFTTPSDQNNRRRTFPTPSMFEEDTRMSIGCDSTQTTPFRSSDMQSCEESQSSLLSSASNTVEGSVKKRAKKMEVCEPEVREFTVEMLAEYEWPQDRNHDTFMIQEQIAEYLGVKSFKRKYPDLIRRPVDMEERNFLFENSLATEKQCDLGLTAVYASEVLDIMCNDYPEKYEEYKRYQREKAFRFARQRLETAVVDRSQIQKDKAISSASDFNTRFNKDRRENRRSCMDLQNFLIQKPTPLRNYNTTASVTHRSHYPIALVPGQFSEYYEKFTSLQLACYPLNTVLVDQRKLDNYLATHPNALESSDESESSDSGDEGSSSSDSDSVSESSSDEEYEDPHCKVCTETPFVNKFGKPEKFVKCSTCKNQAHPSCVEMSTRMYQRTLAYKWQCSSCKTCCKCRKKKDNKMLYCVQCDRGFHIYCLGLRNVPDGQYHCDNCNICSDCGAKSPEGHFNPSLTQQQRQELAMIAQWNHDFIVNPLTNIREHLSTLCLPCFRKEKKNVENE